MKKINFLFFLIFIISISASLTHHGGKLSNKIAFLRNGEVWFSDTSGNSIEQFTNDSAEIIKFIFSPDLKYLAYDKNTVFKSYEDSTNNSFIDFSTLEEIEILNIQTSKIIRKLTPPGGEGYAIVKWLANREMIYYSHSEYEVSGFYLYNADKNTIRDIDYNKRRKLIGESFSQSDSLKAYVDEPTIGKDYNEYLHLVNLKTDDNKIIFSGQGSIFYQCISYNNTMVVFLFVKEIGKKYYDILYLYDTENNLLMLLQEMPASPINDNNEGIKWSFDDRYVALNNSFQVIIIEIQNPANIFRIKGKDFSWIGSDKLIYASGNDIYLFDVINNSKKILIPSGTNPAYLK